MPATNRILSDSRMADKEKKVKKGNSPTEKVPFYEPNTPEPKCRSDLINTGSTFPLMTRQPIRCCGSENRVLRWPRMNR
ncbi:hypothetical protein KUCAC02_027470 [Chaenocephalus aceratus]|uniref:Uncharacterized protein n=1 Tax=Chaenocephalus aceratus TaxID=36190 RepID=A0ACB9W4K4_CHAAC|nr:hypothetical protein KUCAC02_027470 [Chaenocephalus aceratus]